MTRIAAITASNPRFANPGMVTVDLACHGLLSRVCPGTPIDWFTFAPPERCRPYLNAASLPFNFKRTSEHLEEIYDHDLIVVWGDWMQQRSYLYEDVLGPLGFDLSELSENDAVMRELRRSLFLSDAPKSVLSKTIVFGGSILHNAESDYTDAHYAKDLTRLVQGCRRIWTRDPLSAVKIAHLRGDYRSNFLGTDAAFLLQDEDIRSLRSDSGISHLATEKKVGYFFGQRTFAPGPFYTFCNETAKKLGVEAEWIPWFPHAWNWMAQDQAENEHLAFIEKHKKNESRLMFSDLIESLNSYQLIVTDTYHLCINAFRVGTPVLCVGQPQPSISGGAKTLNDLKKHVLYLMYDAMDFYLNHELFANPSAVSSLASKFAQLVKHQQLADNIHDKIIKHANVVETQLTETIGEILASRNQ